MNGFDAEAFMEEKDHTRLLVLTAAVRRADKIVSNRIEQMGGEIAKRFS